MVTNHVTFLEIPVFYISLHPRPLIGITKQETWNNPILGHLANLWKAIPIRRASVDSQAFRSSIEALKRGKIVAIAPEGTRSGNGRLRKANAGVITLAALSGAPVLPVAHFGGERIWDNLKHIRRSRFTIRVGNPLSIPKEAATTRRAREAALNMVMHALADLLPRQYRGYYDEAASR